MNPLILGPILEVGKSLIGRLFPDAEAKAKAEAAALDAAQKAEAETPRQSPIEIPQQ